MRRRTLSKHPIALICLLAMGPLAFFLQNLAFLHPQIVERVFSRGIYPVISGIISRCFSIFPFSVGEWILVSAVIWIPLWAYLLFRHARKRANSRFFSLLSALIHLSAAVCAGYFAFLLLCGLNYSRMTYADSAGYDVSPAEVQELMQVCERLIEEANTFRTQTQEDANGVLICGETLSQICARTNENYALAAQRYHANWLCLTNYSPAKPVLLSRPWAYTQTTGMYFPFTVEANINTVNSPCMLACTIAHEAAHQRGFMREDEANFIAWLVCRASDEATDRYSGTLLALIHAGNALYRADSGLYDTLQAQYSDAVRRDLSAHNAHWAQFEGKVAQVQETVNHAYLQANHQTDGVRSYGRMVDLLIAHQRAGWQ